MINQGIKTFMNVNNIEDDKKQISGDQPLFEFELLPDKPIDPDVEQEDKFGHKDISGTLVSVIEKVEPPFTMGLFGRWGTGKTTIAANVNKVFKNKEGYKCLFFDAWKYERDSLRRQFLIELDDQVFKGRLFFKKILNQSLSKPEIPSASEILKFTFKSGGIKLLLTILGLILLFWIYVIVAGQQEANQGNILGAFATIGGLGLFIEFILSSVQFIHGTKQEYRTDSAEGFEDHFKEAFKEVELKDNTLIVTIDNLDRLENDKAVEVLSDIKTFLTKDEDIKYKVIFLIPCDDDAIRSQLIKKYGSDFDADEFLRKFFNLTLRIPKFIDIDLSNYVRDLLKRTRVQEIQGNIELEGGITNALRNNPREIKQFINSLIPLVGLAKKRNLTIVLDNLAFLSKILLIRQKFPIFYSLLEEKSLREKVGLGEENLIEEYNRLLTIRGWGEDAIKKNIDEYKKFNDFDSGLNRENLSVFISLKQSNEERLVEGWEQYVLAAQEERLEDADKIFLSIKDKGQLLLFDILLTDRIKKIKGTSDLSSFVSTTLEVLKKNKATLESFLNTAVADFPYSKEGLKTSYEDFDPDSIFNFWLPNIVKNKHFSLTKPFVDLLSTSTENKPLLEVEYLKKIFEIINNQPSIFFSFKKELQKNIEQSYSKLPFLLTINSEEVQRMYLTPNAKALFIDSLDYDHMKSSGFEEVLKFWVNLDIPLNETIINSYKKFREIGDVLQNEDEKVLISKHLLSFSKKHEKIFDEKKDDPTLKSEIESLSKILAKHYDEVPSTPKELALTIDFFHSLEINSQKPVLFDRMSRFITEKDDETLKKLTKGKMKTWAKVYPEAVTQRSFSNPKLLIELDLYEELNDTQKNKIVVQVIKQNINPFALLTKLNFSITNSDEVINNIVSRLSNYSITALSELLTCLEKLNIESHSDKVSDLVVALKSYIDKHPSDKEEFQKIIKNVKTGLFNSAQLTDLKS